MNINSFQKTAWNDFFSRSLQELLDSKAFSHKEVSVSFAADNANVFLKPPVGTTGTHTQTLKIKINIEHKSSMISIPKDLIVLPVLGADGFVLDNVRYVLVSTFRLASGWYIKRTNTGTAYLALQRESTEIFSISNSDAGLFVTFSNKYKYPLFDFLRAISGTLDTNNQDILEEFVDCPFIYNAYYAWKESAKYKFRDTHEIAADIYKAFRGGYGSSYSDPVADLQAYLGKNGMRMHTEKIPRFKKFTSFCRAVGTVLAEDITIGNEHFYSGEVLTARALSKIDSAEYITELRVTKNDILYVLRKVPVSLDLTFDEVCCALRVFDQFLAGVGSMDNPDEQFNRVIHTVRDEYEQFVGKAVDTLVKELTQCINNCNGRHDNYIEYICAQAQLSPCVPEHQIVDYIKRGNSSYQQLDETNSLAEFEQSFRITSGVKHVTASARDIHNSEYGRVCPYTTSESKQVGLNRALSLMCGVDSYGFVTTPVYTFSKGVLGKDVVQISALDEAKCIIAPANIDLEQLWVEHCDDPVFTVQDCRVAGEIQAARLEDITHQELSGIQTIGPLIGTVPSANRDSGKRLVMTVSAQRQAIPTWKRERPLVTTGVDVLCEMGYTSAGTYIARYLDSIGIPEAEVPEDTKLYLGTVRDIGDSIEVSVVFLYNDKDYVATQILAGSHGTVNGALKYMRMATPTHQDNGGKYYLPKDVFLYQNDVDVQEYALNKSDVQMGKLKFDSKDIASHSVALGCNTKVLFKSLAGYSYEDSIVVNESFLLRYGLAVIKTKTVSYTLPKGTVVGGNSRDSISMPQLDSLGYPIKGFYIQAGQEILSLKSTTCDGTEKISTRVLGVGESGFVLSHREYQKGGNTVVSIDLGDLLPLDAGDKLEGLHGNKGVIGRILPAHEMMYTEDGEIPDIVLNPLGVLARLNLGQLIEATLGGIAKATSEIQILEPFAPDSIEDIAKAAAKYNLVEKTIYDGRTGLPFARKAMIGNMYMLRLMHTSTSKYNATGNCNANISTRTLQPMRCSGGGQRMSELCTWCLVSYNATETLNSLFTVQSDSYNNKMELDTSIRQRATTDIPYNSNNIDTLRAYFFMLGANVAIGMDGETRIEPATDEFMLQLADGHICAIEDLKGNASTPKSILHDTRVFPVHSNAAENRKQYGYLPFKCKMIMPLYLHSSSVAGLLAGIFTSASEITKIATAADVKKFTCEDIKGIINGTMAFVGWKTLVVDEVHASVIKSDYGVTLPQVFRVPLIICKQKTKSSDWEQINSEVLEEGTGIHALVDLFESYDVINSLCYPAILEKAADVGNVLLFNQRYTLSDLVVSGMLVPPVGYRPVMEADTRSSNPIDAILIRIVSQIKLLLASNLSEGRRRIIENNLYNCLNERLVTNNDKDPENPSILRQLSDHKSGIAVIRDTLLAKRLTYSGRSVISIGPELAPGECGIPVVMLATIFEDHIAAAITDPSSNYILKHIGRLNADNSAKFIRKATRYLAAGNLAGFKTYSMARIKLSSDMFYAELSRECLQDQRAVRTAYQLFERCYTQLIEILEDLLKKYPALLNREPSLHKFSIQGFQAKPIDSYAIQLHPAACHGFNADYDGDQMAAFFPMHARGIQDAKDKMMSDKNLIDPKDGSCIVSLNQDMILGLYFATIHANNNQEYVADSIAKVYHLPKFEGFVGEVYKSAGVCAEILADIQQGLVDVHDTVLCFYDGRRYLSEAGRFIVNGILPNAMGFTAEPIDSNEIKGKYAKLDGISKLLIGTNMTLTKKTIKQVEDQIISYFTDYSLGEDDVHDTLAFALNRFMHFGFLFADLSGITLSLYDFVNLPVKELIKEGEMEAERASEDIEEWYRLGCCDDQQRDDAYVSIWTDATTRLKKKITSEFGGRGTFDRMSNIFMIIDSGARGDISQLLSMSGLIGIVTNSSGRGIPSPIRSSYMDGLSTTAFFQNAATARRQVVSAQLTTADSGTLTREYIYLNEHQHIRNSDRRCDAKSLWIDIDYEVSIPSKYSHAQLVSDISELDSIDFSNFTELTIFPGQEEDCKCAYIEKIKLLMEVCGSKSFTNELLSIVPKVKMDYFICKDADGKYILVEPQVKMSDVSRSQLLYRVLDMNALPAIDRSLFRSVAMEFLGDTPEELGDDIVIGDDVVHNIELNMIARVPIFTVIGCKSTEGICRCCFGLNYSTFAFPDFGEHVGYQAVQAIGNPITQIILDSHKTEYTGEEPVASKLTRILSSRFHRQELPDDVKELPFAVQDNLRVQLSSQEQRVEDDRGVEHGIMQHSVDLYAEDKCVQRIPYTDLSEVNVITGQLVQKGELVIKDIRDCYSIWMSLVEFTEVQKYIWKMLCSCFTSEFIFARHFEIFARSISEFGVAEKTDLENGIVKGNIYLTSLLDKVGVSFEPVSVGMKSAMTYSNKVIAGIAQERLVARMTAAIVSGAADNPNSNIGKFAIGALSTAEKPICTKSVLSTIAYEPAVDTENVDTFGSNDMANVIVANSDVMSAEDLFGGDDSSINSDVGAGDVVDTTSVFG